MVNAGLGLIVGALTTTLILYIKPDFFWEQRQVREAREVLGDRTAERFGYIITGTLALIGLLVVLSNA